MLTLLHTGVAAYRRLPFPGFKRFLRRHWDRYQAGKGPRVVTACVEGINYQLHLGELIDSSIYFTGSFEPDTAAAIRRLVGPGDVVLDIGANIGCHTLPISRLVGMSGRVISFEPMPWARSKLESNIALNGFQNIEVVPYGLSDQSRREVVHFRSSWSLDEGGQSSEDPASVPTCAVDFVRLDDFLEARALKRVDFIKMDVDGYEFRVLLGARVTLSEKRPSILMELGAYTLRAVGDDIEELVRYLADLKYSFYDEKTFDLYPSAESVVRAVPPQSTINVVASPALINRS